MKVLVTGIAGFLGSHVAGYYREKGDDVIGIDNLNKYELSRIPYLNPHKVRKYVINYLHDIGAELVVGDICRHAALLDLANKFKPDYIIHCAAQPAMTIALESPSMSCENNVLGTVNVLDVARILKTPVAICSTIHVYGNGINDTLMESDDRFYRTPTLIKETDRVLTGKVTGLHIDKYGSELYARSFIESYDMNIAIFRLTGLYGDRQFAGSDHGWISAFGMQTILDYPINVYGTDKQVRDILYVSDAVNAFDKWYDKPVSGVYNICGGVNNIVSIKSVLKIISNITNKKQNIKILPYRQGDLHYFAGDYSKASETFGWKPTIIPKNGLKYMVEWILSNKGMLEWF